MILVDTNIWIDHLRKNDARLARYLDDDLVLMHPWIRGELALGRIADRDKFFKYLDYLPSIRPAKDGAVLSLIESKNLAGRGIGWVDAGLLASCLAGSCLVWTRDERLARIARELGIKA